MYNGWKNRQTWIVATEIANDEVLYNLALNSFDFNDFMNNIRSFSWMVTGVDSPDLCVEEFDEMIQDLRL